MGSEINLNGRALRVEGSEIKDRDPIPWRLDDPMLLDGQEWVSSVVHVDWVQFQFPDGRRIYCTRQTFGGMIVPISLR